MQPSAHKSVNGPLKFISSISGATYKGVPTNVPLPPPIIAPVKEALSSIAWKSPESNFSYRLSSSSCLKIFDSPKSVYKFIFFEFLLYKFDVELWIEKEVIWFEVSMHYSFLMQIFQRWDNFSSVEFS